MRNPFSHSPFGLLDKNPFLPNKDIVSDSFNWNWAQSHPSSTKFSVAGNSVSQLESFDNIYEEHLYLTLNLSQFPSGFKFQAEIDDQMGIGIGQSEQLVSPAWSNSIITMLNLNDFFGASYTHYNYGIQQNHGAQSSNVAITKVPLVDGWKYSVLAGDVLIFSFNTDSSIENNANQLFIFSRGTEGQFDPPRTVTNLSITAL